MTELGKNMPKHTHHLFINKAEMAGGYCVWLATEKADFLRGRYSSCSWDVGELKNHEKAIIDGDLLKTNVKFWKRLRFFLECLYSMNLIMIQMQNIFVRLSKSSCSIHPCHPKVKERGTFQPFSQLPPQSVHLPVQLGWHLHQSHLAYLAYHLAYLQHRLHPDMPLPWSG